MFQFPVLGSLCPTPNWRLLFSAEATSEKESKSTGLAVTPRKTSQVNKEELAGKEVLSKQYFKDDGNKKLGHIHKDASAGNQATPRSGISTGRSGIPGIFIRVSLLYRFVFSFRTLRMFEYDLWLCCF